MQDDTLYFGVSGETLRLSNFNITFVVVEESFVSVPPELSWSIVVVVESFVSVPPELSSSSVVVEESFLLVLPELSSSIGFLHILDDYTY